MNFLLEEHEVCPITLFPAQQALRAPRGDAMVVVGHRTSEESSFIGKNWTSIEKGRQKGGILARLPNNNIVTG